MAITLTIELSDELEKQVIVQAKQRLVSPEKIVLQCLSQTLTGNQIESEGPQSTELSSIKSDLTEDELEASHQSLLKFAGAIGLGHATGLDNHSNEQDYYKGNLCSAMRSTIL